MNQDPEVRFMKVVLAVVLAVVLLGLVTCSTEIVNTGRVQVATYFGKVQQVTLEEGIHFVNPLYDWTSYDTRQKQITQDAVAIPTGDKLLSHIDLTVKYRLVGSLAAKMLAETGDEDAVIETHLIPKFRSLAREIGKGVEKSEYLFLEEVQQQMQNELHTRLVETVAPFGIEIQDVLIRHIQLPDIIQNGIDATIARRQDSQKQKEELERYSTEQQQKVASAQAEYDAAILESQKIKALADARAYEIKALNDAISDNPAYVQLEALRTLAEMSRSSSSKFYFMDGNSPMPLPLMHIGQVN